jgi:hypothetical protein
MRKELQMRTRDVMCAWLACATLIITFPAAAQTASAVKRTQEASLVINGQIEITPQGAVKSYSLERDASLPSEVRQLLSQQIPQWKFHPVVRGGHAVHARSGMSLRLVARKLVNDDYAVSVRSARFDGDPQQGETVVKGTMTPPQYPKTAAKYGVAGDVYLLVQVGRDGKVQHVASEQTNLLVADRGPNMKKWREMFESSAISVAKTWTFAPPTQGDAVDDPFWQLRIPVSYRIGLPNEAADVVWQGYIPGPRNVIPWAVPDLTQMGVDAGADGQLSQIGAGLQLMTPLNGQAG